MDVIGQTACLVFVSTRIEDLLSSLSPRRSVRPKTQIWPQHKYFIRVLVFDPMFFGLAHRGLAAIILVVWFSFLLQLP